MSLFLKIFLWFWGAMAVLGLSLVAVQLSIPDDPVIEAKRVEIFSALAASSYNAVRAYEIGGDAQLQSYMDRLERRSGTKVYLFDPEGRQRGTNTAGGVPADVRELAARSARLREPQVELSTFRIIAAQPVLSLNGNFLSGNYVFCGTISRSLLAATRQTPETNWLRLFSVFSITGLFCYGLARYLAAPVGKIRRAAQRIAAGDLSARVEPNRVPRGHDEIAGLANDFDKMADRLEHLVTAQNRLLGDVSHELRSPLARLNLALELARRGDESKRMAAFARIEREADRLDELIGELLTLARLEAGLSERQLAQNVDVAQIAADVAADADFEAQNAGRGVRVIYSGPIEGAIGRGDSELLRRALENVTRNAIRHTDENTNVEVDFVREKQQIQVTIADNGPGVPESDRETIFNPFFRVEDARERSQNDRGTGLGLSIAERAVKAHGGTIQAFNRPQGGLSIEIELPILAEPRRLKVLNGAFSEDGA